MTSTPVNVQGFVPGAMYGTNRVQGTENKGDFSKIFESQKSVTEQAVIIIFLSYFIITICSCTILYPFNIWF